MKKFDRLATNVQWLRTVLDTGTAELLVSLCKSSLISYHQLFHIYFTRFQQKFTQIYLQKGNGDSTVCFRITHWTTGLSTCWTGNPGQGSPRVGQGTLGRALHMLDREPWAGLSTCWTGNPGQGSPRVGQGTLGRALHVLEREPWTGLSTCWTGNPGQCSPRVGEGTLHRAFQTLISTHMQASLGLWTRAFENFLKEVKKKRKKTCKNWNWDGLKAGRCLDAGVGCRVRGWVGERQPVLYTWSI